MIPTRSSKYCKLKSTFPNISIARTVVIKHDPIYVTEHCRDVIVELGRDIS